MSVKRKYRMYAIEFPTGPMGHAVGRLVRHLVGHLIGTSWELSWDIPWVMGHVVGYISWANPQIFINLLFQVRQLLVRPTHHAPGTISREDKTKSDRNYLVCNFELSRQSSMGRRG